MHHHRLSGDTLAGVIQLLDGLVLRARTIEFPSTTPLLDYLQPTGTAWIRKGEGMIGIGEIARLEGADFAAAEAWWTDLCARTIVESDLAEHPGSGPIALASFSFDRANTTHGSVVVVPRIVIGRRGGRSWLTMLAEGDQAWPDLPDPLPAPAPVSGAQLVAGSLSRSAWLGIVADAVSRIGHHGLEKVVLARSEEFHTATPLDPRWLVAELARTYPSCWTFHVDGLVGASPEMLLRREGGLATSRVLAGTIRRSPSTSTSGPSAEELDLKLAHALARSSKNLIEHELAVASVARALEPFCSGMNVPDAPYVLELPNVLHLASDVTAVARHDVSALRLAGELHPSAAVCGTPTAQARELIAELENLDRGRYSGPVGWLDSRGDGELAIALRSGWLDPTDPHRITVYAGCGIVAESDPAEEYAETEAKLLPMHEVLGLS
jgi:menaquinone-specific isochorismate synthase